ncbi:unnamed protein product [Linum tenue]|uniref:Uncharacterized protein n=1 Tax=Linum tenue TaxID=586396 RepID=A0AAV0S9K3_9ROSI|nr:unnamed protein product [Linum tenue]
MKDFRWRRGRCGGEEKAAKKSRSRRTAAKDGGERLMLSIVRIARMMDSWCVVAARCV